MNTPNGSLGQVRRFELVNDETARFWELTIHEISLEVCYGKIGTTGQTHIKLFLDSLATHKKYEQIIAEKIGKGYVEVVAW